MACIVYKDYSKIIMPYEFKHEYDILYNNKMRFVFVLIYLKGMTCDT